MACISPICKKCKSFILALKSPTYRDFMIKKSLKSKTSKSHTWAPLISCLHLTSLWPKACSLHPRDFKFSFGILVIAFHLSSRSVAYSEYPRVLNKLPFGIFDLKLPVNIFAASQCIEVRSSIRSAVLVFRLPYTDLYYISCTNWQTSKLYLCNGHVKSDVEFSPNSKSSSCGHKIINIHGSSHSM
jgi:hypothetical protein